MGWLAGLQDAPASGRLREYRPHLIDYGAIAMSSWRYQIPKGEGQRFGALFPV
jgi:hypothetical protein